MACHGAYCLLIEEGEPSTFQDDVSSSGAFLGFFTNRVKKFRIFHLGVYLKKLLSCYNFLIFSTEVVKIYMTSV